MPNGSPESPTLAADEPLSPVLFLRAALGLLGVDLGLRVLGFQRTRTFLRKRPGAAADDPARAIRRAARAVDAAARHHLYRMTCLRRSLVLQHELRRLGVETELQLGVRRVGESLEAHAWLEHEGQPVREHEDPHSSYGTLGRADDRADQEPE